MAFIFRAEIFLRQGEIELADRSLKQAAEIFRSLDTYRGLTWSWELAARVAATRGRPEHALMLFAATVETRRKIGLVEPSRVRERIESDLTRLRDSLGSERAARLWREGAALSRDAVTALVLADGSTVS